MRCHFTATGFVVSGDRTLLHWHQRLQQWMPPGGHLEPDEDPVTALLREIHEETGLEAEILPLAQVFPFSYPGQLPPPYTILLEASPEPGEAHQHIDLIYFCRPLATILEGAPPQSDMGMLWVDEATLRSRQPLDLAGCGLTVPMAEDVRILALKAIETLRQAFGRGQ